MKLPVNIPILSFLGRYWLLLLLFGAFLLLTLNESAFKSVGAILYVPALACAALLIVVFLRHIFFPSTLDEDVRTGKFTAGWNALAEAEKVRWILGVTVGLFLGVCLIVAALAK